jgi:tape measure domain-containing protein
MADDIEQLVLTISADVRQMQRALRRLEGDTVQTTRRIENHFSGMGRKIESSLAGFGRGFLGTIAAGFSARGVQQLLDSATRIRNALRVAGLEGEELSRVYDRLFASAQKNAAPLESLVTLYGRASLVQRELGVSSQELLAFTDNVALALRVAGTDAQAASGALLQLSQALGSGVVRAEEFNSILEGLPTIAQAAAAGLEEAGGSVAKLRSLVIDGKISSEVFFRAFEAGAVILQDKVAGSAITVSQAFTKVQNTLIDAAGRIDEISGASSEAAQLLDRLAGVINGLANVAESAANGPLGKFVGVLNQINEAIKTVLPGISALGLLDEGVLNKVAGDIGPSPGPDVVTTAGGKTSRVGQDAIQSAIDRAFGGAGVKPVSVKDFAPPVGSKKSGGGSRLDELQREIRQIRERTAAIQADTAAQAGLNPLIDDYGFALERARARQDLLTAAERAGIAVTPELKAQIDTLATGYANASVAAQKLEESQDKAREAAEEFRSIGKDVLGGFISDLRNGTSAADALSNALGKIADRLFDMALDGLFSPKKAGGGGFFTSIISGIGKLFGFAGGGYTGAGPRSKPAGVVHAGEYVFSKPAVDRIGVGRLSALHRGLRGYAEGGLVMPSLRRPATPSTGSGGFIDVGVAVAVENGQLVPLVTSISGQVAGQMVKQANKNWVGRASTASARGV